MKNKFYSFTCPFVDIAEELNTRGLEQDVFVISMVCISQPNTVMAVLYADLSWRFEELDPFDI